MASSGIEWIAGDVSWSRLYSLYTFAILLVGIAFVLLEVLGLLHQFALVPPVPVVVPLWAESFGSLAFAAAVLIHLFLPWQRPIVRRVGISKSGVLLQYPLRTYRIPWSEAVWITSSCLGSRKWSSFRVLLTPDQSARVHSFQPLTAR